MRKNKITLERDFKNLNGFLSDQSLSTDAFNAISSIPGTKDVEILNESEGEVEISYVWTKSEGILDTALYLSKYGCTVIVFT